MLYEKLTMVFAFSVVTRLFLQRSFCIELFITVVDLPLCFFSYQNNDKDKSN